MALSQLKVLLVVVLVIGVVLATKLKDKKCHDIKVRLLQVRNMNNK